MFTFALTAGYLNSLKGRGLSEKYGWIYSKYVFLLFICALIYSVHNSPIEALAGFLVFGIITWTGTGGLMQAFTGEVQKEKEFIPIDFLAHAITGINNTAEGYRPSIYRRYGVWYASLMGCLQFVVAALMTGFGVGAYLLLLSGLIVGAMRYLPERISRFSWLACEFILGAIMFLSVTL